MTGRPPYNRGDPPIGSYDYEHRRQMLASVGRASVAVLATSALGTSAFVQTASAQTAMPGESGHGRAEMKHAKETGMVGSLSLATSRVAEGKASDAMVRSSRLSRSPSRRPSPTS